MRAAYPRAGSGVRRPARRSDRLWRLERLEVLEHALDPSFGDLVGLHREARRADLQVVGSGDAEVLEHAAHDPVGAVGELLVGDLQRLIAEAEEVGVPRGVVRAQL